MIKKILFYSFVFAFNYFLFELIAYFAFQAKFGEYDRHEMQIDRIQTINTINSGPVFTAPEEQVNTDEKIQKEIIHPYYGYAIDGKRRIDDCTSESFYDCHTRIKVPADSKFVKRSSSRLIVGVLGGSVAVGTISGTRPRQLYESLLKALPEYKGREIIVYRLAAGGFRQPQPLMMLNYFYSLGAEFDIIINLDGFNDVAIPVAEYKNSALHPSYPRSWGHRVASTASKDVIDHLAKKQVVQEAHLSKAQRMSNPWFRNSPISNLLWRIIDVRYTNKLGEINQSIGNLDAPDEDKRDFFYEQVGPDYDFTTWDDLGQYAVDIWAQSSHLIHAIATANDVKYFHFLQPNQYIEGSKPKMNAAEKRLAFMKNGGGYGNIYKRYYPRIMKKKEWLAARGVELIDLTYLFENVAEPLYVDSCCHVNSKGYNMIVENIVDTIHLSNIGKERNNGENNGDATLFE